MKESIVHHIKSYFNIGKTDKRDAMAEFLRYLRENKYLYLLLCQEFGSDSLREHTWNITKDYYLKSDYQDTPHGDFRKELPLIYNVYGRTAVIELWLRNGTPMTEEDLADILINFTDQG
jgi:hypothetical protein